MKEESKTLLIRCLYTFFIDIGLVVLFVVGTLLSNDIPIFAAFALLTLLLSPIIRGVVAYLLLERILLPGGMLIVEFLLIALLTGGVSSDIFTLHGAIIVAAVLVVSTVSSLIAAVTVGNRRG